MISVLAFWVALSLVLYSYCLYPIVLVVLSVFRRDRPISQNAVDLPRVTVVISAYNEKDTLASRIDNLFKLDYPSERLNFLIGSDGSDDGSNDILNRCQSDRLRILMFRNRRGKAAMLNELVPQVTAEIVVLSDANTRYDSMAIRNLVCPFSDSRVGAVCGQLLLESPGNSVGGFGERLYWKYENALKRLESNVSSALSAAGAVYAIRKRLFHPLPTSKIVADDFLIPLNILRAGYRVVYEPTAIAYEKPAGSMIGEFRRKVRIGAANFHGLSEYGRLLLPEAGFIAFALWSHKIIRWIAPFLLVTIFVSSGLAYATSRWFELVFGAELVFFSLAGFGYIAERFRIRVGFFGIAYYLVAMNVALLIGFFKFLFKWQEPTWTTVRE